MIMSDEPTVKWFGKHYPAPIYDTCPEVPTPAGAPCVHCDKPIQAGDDGIVYANGPIAHRNCFMREVGLDTLPPQDPVKRFLARVAELQGEEARDSIERFLEPKSDRAKQDELMDRIERGTLHRAREAAHQTLDRLERRRAKQCGHVPARPDVDLTICWKCSVEIVNDPDTQLWRPLTVAERLVKLETVRQCRDLCFTLHQSEYTRVLWEKIETKLAPSIRLAESILGRWIVVNGQDESLAWSGSRWEPHRNGMGIEAQVSNFETREEAAAYAAEQFPGKTPDPGP